MRRLASVVLAVGFLAASLFAANARSCEIFLASPTQAGSVLLLPGQYRVSLDGGEAVFQDVRSTRSFRTAVKVEDNGSAYDATRISTTHDSGARRMNAIEFEGSGTRIEF
jgi:hypothetical protein